MSTTGLLDVLWRQKWIVVITVLVATVATYVASSSLPKVYESNATLLVRNDTAAANDFEAIQSGQVLAKTFAELIQSENVASRVGDRLGLDESPEEILGRMKFAPISDTQLISVKAEGGSPAEAVNLANAYADVFTEYAESQLAQQTNGEVAVADRAPTPQSAVRPRPKVYAAVMFVLSLFAGAGLALLRDRFDPRLGRDEEVSRLLELPILAHIPRLAERPGKPGGERGYLEAFRLLRANLSFLQPGEPLTAVMVTSPDASEGKSTSALALARVVAEQGRRVALIECDLRRPALARLAGLDEVRAPGVAQYLVSTLGFDEMMSETRFENVYVAPAGAIPPDPSSLLRPQLLDQLVREASSWADFVILDAPPASAGADAAMLAQTGVATLLLVNRRRTHRRRAVAAVRQLRQAGARLAGVLLNEVPPSDQGYYGYYGVGAEPEARRGGAPLPGVPVESER